MQAPNHTQVSNEFIALMPQMKPTTVAVGLAIFRKTMGWHKTSESIPISQIMKMTGIKGRETVRMAIEQLIELRIVDQVETPRGYRYDLVFEDEGSKNIPDGGKNLTPSEAEGGQKSTPQKKEEKDTTEKKKELSPYATCVDRYYRLHQEVTGITPHIDASTGANLKRLLSSHSPEIVCAKLDAYYHGSFWFTKNGEGRSFKQFVAHYNEINIPKPGEQTEHEKAVAAVRDWGFDA